MTEQNQTDGSYNVTVELPSRGKFYGEKLPGGKVTLRPISVMEEKLLTTRGGRMQVIDKIMQKCILSECPPLRELLLTDKFFLLLSLRAISYGNEYQYRLTCSSCGAEFQHTTALPEGLTMRVASDGDTEPFEVELPMTKKKLALRFLRGSDEEAIEDFVKTIPGGTKGEDNGDPGYVYRIARTIVSIDGEQKSDTDKIAFCEHLMGRDSLAIRRAMAAHETGIDMNVEGICPACRVPFKLAMPMSGEFFPSGSVS